MGEGQPPPSSSSTPAAGPKENVKRMSGSDADAAAAAAADNSKPRSWRGALRIVDDEPPWGRPVQELEDPAHAAWSDGLRMIDNEPAWGKRMQEGEKPLSLGHERRQGHDAGKGFSPRKQGQGTASRGSGEEEDEECWLPRKGGRHISDEPQDISLPTKRGRLHTDETQNIPLPKTRRRPGHDLEESEDKMITLASQDTSLVVKGAKALSRDKKVVYLDFVFGSRSKREVKIWHCVCQATNIPRRKLVFCLPEFRCGCGRKFLQENDLDFCLADIRVNFELVVSKIFEQIGPHCIANALCQAMLMMHTMDCIAESTDVKEAMLHIDPEDMIVAYRAEYPSMDKGNQSGIQPSSVHEFIKMALMLKNRGIELEDGSFFRIGDISFIAKDNHEAICEELANGVPLLAVITPGVNFRFLQYCQVYRPPLLRHFHECNNYHKQQKPRVQHEAHMVVLIGPAFKAKGQNPGRAYYFANSHARWCERKVKDDHHDSVPGIKKPVEYGIGKIEEEGLVYSVIKLWKFGETAGPGSITLEDEDEEANKYRNKISNKQKFTGEYMARSSP